jgi:glycosyltransferase involved in cell wall biosynthesis
MMDAAKAIQDKQDDVEFVFVSNKSSHDKLNAAKNEKSVNNLRLIPFQPESALKTLMESGDVHIISLNEEAEGMMVPSKFYSALAANRPSIFIGPKHSEIAKIITDFDCGCAIEQGDKEALIKAIENYRNDEDIWFKHQEGASEAARRFVPEQSWQVWLQRMQSLMRQP